MLLYKSTKLQTSEAITDDTIEFFIYSLVNACENVLSLDPQASDLLQEELQEELINNPNNLNNYYFEFENLGGCGFDFDIDLIEEGRMVVITQIF